MPDLRRPDRVAATPVVAPAAAAERRRTRLGLVTGLLVVLVAHVVGQVATSRAMPLTAVLLGPLFASALSRPREVALVGLAACTAAVGAVVHEELHGVEAQSRVLLVLLSAVGCVLIAAVRTRHEHALALASRTAALSTALQQGLVPRLASTSRVDVRSVYRPCLEELVLGGDFVDVVAVPGAGPGAVAFCVGDVTGHDPAAASLGASLRAAWRTLALTGGEPVAWLAALDAFTRSEAPEDRLATVCVGVFDPASRRLTVASAGHPCPVLLRDRAEVVEVEAGPPLGLPVDLGLAWEAETLVLDRDAALFLYTDGLIEGRRAPGSPHRYGEESLAAWLSLAGAPNRLTAADLDRLLLDVQSANGGALPDDVTVVVLASTPAPAREVAVPVLRTAPAR